MWNTWEKKTNNVVGRHYSLPLTCQINVTPTPSPPIGSSMEKDQREECWMRFGLRNEECIQKCPKGATIRAPSTMTSMWNTWEIDKKTVVGCHYSCTLTCQINIGPTPIPPILSSMEKDREGRMMDVIWTKEWGIHPKCLKGTTIRALSTMKSMWNTWGIDKKLSLGATTHAASPIRLM